MATLRRVQVVWTTGAGGSGLSNFYSSSGDDATAGLGTFFNAIKGLFPNAVSWTIPSSGDTLDTATGQLNGAWTGGTAATVSATGGAATYAAGTGTYVRWVTGSVVNGRKVVGRTFLCPLTAATYENNGRLQAANTTTIQNAVNTLVGLSLIRLYSRPHGVGPISGDYSIVAGVATGLTSSLRTRRT